MGRSRGLRGRDRAGEEGVAGGAEAAESRRPTSFFSKLFQIEAVLLQAFPNKALAVLWDFKGLQGFQTGFDALPNFSSADSPLSVSYRTPSDRIPPPRAEHASEGVHLRGERERVPRGRVRSWRRSDPGEENFELSTNSVYWKGMFKFVPAPPHHGVIAQ